MLIVKTAISLGVGYALAAMFFFGRTLPAGQRTVLFVLLSSLLLPCPLLVPGHYPVIRVLIATTLALFLADMWDLHLDPARDRRLGAGEYFAFLMNHCWMVARAQDCDFHRLPIKRRLRHFAAWSVAFCFSSAILCVTFMMDWKRTPFLIEHAVKAVVAGFWILCGFSIYGAAWRLAGVRSFRFADNVLLSYSPAEFWRRWNRPFHRWFQERVFGPAGGMRHPVWAVLLAFAVSGAAHEYVLAISVGRPTGYMMAFFLVQGLAAVGTRRFRPTRRNVVPAVALTMAFTITSSVLFFAPVNEMVSFYANDIPRWIQPW